MITALLFCNVSYASPFDSDSLKVEFCSQSKMDIFPDSFVVRSSIIISGKSWDDADSKAHQAESDIDKLLTNIEGMMDFSPSNPVESPSLEHNSNAKNPQPRQISLVKQVVVKEVKTAEDVKSIEELLRSNYNVTDFEFTPNISKQLTQNSSYQLQGVAYKDADNHLKTILNSMGKNSGEIIGIAPSNCSVSEGEYYSSYSPYEEEYDAASRAGKKTLNNSFWVIAKVK